MKLRDWMRRERHTDLTFIELVNHVLRADDHKTLTWRAVAPWRTGHTVPRPPVVEAIAKVTGGEVTYDDHAAEHKERA